MSERIIAIGDVHGCSATLAALIRAIDPTAQDTLDFLGDYIDRGPDSRGVVEQVIALGKLCTVVPLLGNHEEMVLAALEGGQSEVRFWLKFGGDVALASYGWKDGPDLRPDELWSLIPRGHVPGINSHPCLHGVIATQVATFYNKERRGEWGSCKKARKKLGFLKGQFVAGAGPYTPDFTKVPIEARKWQTFRGDEP